MISVPLRAQHCVHTKVGQCSECREEVDNDQKNAIKRLRRELGVGFGGEDKAEGMCQ